MDATMNHGFCTSVARSHALAGSVAALLSRSAAAPALNAPPAQPPPAALDEPLASSPDQQVSIHLLAAHLIAIGKRAATVACKQCSSTLSSRSSAYNITQFARLLSTVISGRINVAVSAVWWAQIPSVITVHHSECAGTLSSSPPGARLKA